MSCALPTTSTTTTTQASLSTQDANITVIPQTSDTLSQEPITSDLTTLGSNNITMTTTGTQIQVADVDAQCSDYRGTESYFCRVC